jgi:UDP-2,3-diacylglucosamine pyrophosphatase LpxH
VTCVIRYAVTATRHTLVLSDVHLAEAVEGEGAWMRYRQRKFFPDEDFRRFVDHTLATLGSRDELDLIFGGDFIEFEHPGKDGGDPPRTEGESVATLERILSDHEAFFRAIADVVRAGHRVVFVVGNHDVQLSFPRVQQRLCEFIGAMVPELSADERAKRIRVRTWFYQTADGVHVEHGHQYDAYCSFRDPLRPLAPEREEIFPTVGSVAFRHLIARMGYFNAYDERSFMLSVPAYFAHWAKHYLFSRHSLATTWFLGAVRVVGTMLAARPAKEVAKTIQREAAAARDAFAKANAVNREWIENHAALFAEPADDTPTRIVREMRLDHAMLASIALSGIFVAAFKPKLGLIISASAVAAGVANALLQPHAGVEAEYDRVERVARHISRIYRARAVVFGHTHIPSCEEEEGVLYCNTGSWTPDAPGADEPEEAPKKRGRPVVWLRRPLHDRRAPIEGGLYRFGENGLTPQIVATSRDRASLVDVMRPTIV